MSYKNSLPNGIFYSPSLRQYVNVGNASQHMGTLQPTLPQQQRKALQQPTPSWAQHQQHMAPQQPMFSLYQQPLMGMSPPLPLGFAATNSFPAVSAPFQHFSPGRPQPGFLNSFAASDSFSASSLPFQQDPSQWVFNPEPNGQVAPAIANTPQYTPETFAAAGPAGGVLTEELYGSWDAAGQVAFGANVLNAPAPMELPVVPELEGTQEASIDLATEEEAPPREFFYMPFLEAMAGNSLPTHPPSPKKPLLPTPPPSPKQPPKTKTPNVVKERLNYAARFLDSSANGVEVQLIRSFANLSDKQQRKYCELAWHSNEAALADLREMAVFSPNFSDIYYMRLRGEAIKNTPQGSMTEEQVTETFEEFVKYKEELKGTCREKVRMRRQQIEYGHLWNCVGNIRGQKKGEKRKAREEAAEEYGREIRAEVKRMRLAKKKGKGKGSREEARADSAAPEEANVEDIMAGFANHDEEEAEEQSKQPARASSPALDDFFNEREEE